MFFVFIWCPWKNQQCNISKCIQRFHSDCLWTMQKWSFLKDGNTINWKLSRERNIFIFYWNFFYCLHQNVTSCINLLNKRSVFCAQFSQFCSSVSCRFQFVINLKLDEAAVSMESRDNLKISRDWMLFSTRFHHQT